MIASEQEHLASFEAKLQLIRDRVVSVARQYHTGCYLIGRPGTSKTFTVKEELDMLQCPWTYKNARMTPMGLFDLIAEHPEHVIVLDDITTLFKSDQAMQVLLAALDGVPGSARTVSYKSKDRNEQVPFTGSIIAISNVPLRCDPLARALGSRVVTLEHEPSDEEIAAYMRVLATSGGDGLTEAESSDVAEFVIAETRECDLRLDLRHLTKALQDYRQHKEGEALTSWRDLLRTSLTKLATEPVAIATKQDEIEVQRRRVQEALQRFPCDSKAQQAASGLSKSTFYVRRKEVLAAADMNVGRPTGISASVAAHCTSG